MNYEEDIAELAAAICDTVKKRLGVQYRAMLPILALESAKQFFMMEHILQYQESGSRTQAKAEVRKRFNPDGTEKQSFRNP